MPLESVRTASWSARAGPVSVSQSYTGNSLTSGYNLGVLLLDGGNDAALLLLGSDSRGSAEMRSFHANVTARGESTYTAREVARGTVDCLVAPDDFEGGTVVRNNAGTVIRDVQRKWSTETGLVLFLQVHTDVAYDIIIDDGASSWRMAKDSVEQQSFHVWGPAAEATVCLPPGDWTVTVERLDGSEQREVFLRLAALEIPEAFHAQIACDVPTPATDSGGIASSPPLRR